MRLKEIYKLGELEILNKFNDIELKEHKLIDLFWESTLSCNAKCKHCGSSAEIKKYNNELTTQEIKNAFKQISDDFDATKILINVTGGEPLVRKDLFDVMKYASNELNFNWGMTTNGILLNKENIKNLKNSNIDTISISLDGLKDTHDNFRGVKSFDLILKNIKDLKKANFLKHLQITTVFNKSNINELEKLYNLFIDLNIDSWRLVSMDPIGRANENTELLLDSNDLENLLNFIVEKNKLKKLNLQYGCPSFLGLKYEKEVRSHYFKCRTGINVASILSNGDLFVCPNVPRNINLIQGNIKKDNFKQIWETKYTIFRDKNTLKCNTCQDCKYWNYCLGGSFHTFDLKNKTQNKCVYKMLEKKKH